MKLAIYAITVNGARQAQRLKKALPFADVFVAQVAINDTVNAELLSFPLSDFVAEKFAQYDGHIFIFASGIVTRVISPLIKDKRLDPAVVCLDEQAKFAISMLSGHRGGANELTQRVAHLVKATPVITTASDVSESVSADMFGAPFGWVLDPISECSITSVSASIVNDEPVAIVQESGEKNWWNYDKRMPAHLITSNTLDSIDPNYFKGLLLVSDQNRLELNQWQNRVVVWRPKSLVLGIGCDRNTPLSVLEAGLKAFMQQHNLAIDSVCAVSSIDLKKDEQAIIALSAQKQWPFVTYSPEQLDGLAGIQNPSDYVKKVTGSCSVSEAAALRHSNTDTLLVPKWVFKQDGFNMTLSCCRKLFSESLVQQNRKNWFGAKKHGSEQRHGITEQISTKESDTENTNTGFEDTVSVTATPPTKLNAHGNAVLEGYQCKPVHADLDRAMLFHRYHILLCEGKRCVKSGSKNLAHDLRMLLKQMGLASGNQRIKISRTLCAGACRNRSTLVIYERNSGASTVKDQRSTEMLTGCEEFSVSVNNAQWLRNVEQLSQQQWQALFRALADNQPINQVIGEEYFAAVEGPAMENNCG
ncbi:cobalamin biosynthesis protein [Vibrio sp. MA40-2]|uniref:cobalamin biosynthesis protein n=1 Tax=Vibrio sp. MA40-2 TaxID=3391828 RepID=UPI0039A47161